MQGVRDGALATFYIPFYEDAGYGALAWDKDPAIKVPDEFVPFLRDLGTVLRKCANAGSPVAVSLTGFASTTKWYAIETDTAPAQLDYVKSVLKTRHTKETKGPLQRAAVAAGFGRVGAISSSGSW
jgi:hypothetical protein